jgi:dTDP-4-dehydrorhamnose reductase
MMQILLTGMNGTVAPALARHLNDGGHGTLAWDRSVTSPDDPAAVRSFIEATRPDALVHLAMGSPSWAETMAAVSAERKIPFLFTSTVSVYAHTQRGPLTPDVKPEPNDDYGRYKLECERLVRAANARAIIARLAWQIGTAPGSNNMVDYLERTYREKGRIDASTNWFPACAFLEDTSDALARLLTSGAPGLYHLDGNPGLSFFEIATNLNRIHGGRWNVVAAGEPVQDNRMDDPRVTLRPITDHFG